MQPNCLQPCAVTSNDPATTHLTIVGGGGQLIKHFGSYDPEQVTIVDDICAAAKGYEYMAYRQMLRG